MSRFAMLSTTLWSALKVRRASDAARALWAYLLSSEPTMPIPGVILGGPAAHAERLERSVEWFHKSLDELIRLGFRIRADLDARLIWLPNAIGKYQPPTNAATVAAWGKAWDIVPACALKHEIWKSLRAACAPFVGEKLNQSKATLPAFEVVFPEPPAGLPDGQVDALPGGARGVRGGCSHQDQDQDQEQDQHQEHEQERAAPVGAPTQGELAGVEVGKGKARRGPKTIGVTDWSPNEIAISKCAEYGLEMRFEEAKFRGTYSAQRWMRSRWDSKFLAWLAKSWQWKEQNPAKANGKPGAIGAAPPRTGHGVRVGDFQ